MDALNINIRTVDMKRNKIMQDNYFILNWPYRSASEIDKRKYLQKWRGEKCNVGGNDY